MSAMATPTPPPPDGRKFTFWGGPADGFEMVISRCEHGDWPDAQTPLRRTNAQGVFADEVTTYARYSYNWQNDRYEFVGEVAAG